MMFWSCLLAGFYSALGMAICIVLLTALWHVVLNKTKLSKWLAKHYRQTIDHLMSEED